MYMGKINPKKSEASDLSKLEKAATGNKNVKEEIILIENETANPSENSISNEPEKITEPPIIESEKKEEIKSNEDNGLDIFEDIKKSTNEDISNKNIKEQVSTLNNLVNSDNPSEDFDSFATKEAYKVKAGVIVEICDVVFMIICLLLTWDFSDENQRKFTLVPERKKAIQLNLAKLYELEGKKQDPKKSIVWLIVGSYAPMLLVALVIMINRLKNKKEQKKQQLQISEIENSSRMELAQLRSDNLALANEIQRMKSEVTKETKNEVIKTPPFGKTNNPIKIKSRGRHKKDCNCEKCITKRKSKK